MRNEHGQFLIDSEYLKSTKGRARGNMKCEVERYERGTDLNIKDWVSQMETYFTVGQIPPEAFVGFMLMKIVPKHLDEIKEYRTLDYLSFREKLLEVFEEPDLTTTHLNALASIAQDRDETISAYMRRVRLLVLKAHPNLEHSARERILITNFMLGLHDKDLASSLAVVRVQTAAEAERLASEGEAMRRDQRSRKSTGNYLLPSGRTSMSRSRAVDEPELLEVEGEDEEEENELFVAPSDTEPRRADSQNNRARRREAASSYKCFECGQYGHYRVDCPRRGKLGVNCSTARPSMVECRLCGNNHFVQECPHLESAKRLLTLDASCQGEPKSTTALTSALDNTKCPFKKDGTAVVSAVEDSRIRVCDTMIRVDEEAAQGTDRMALFFLRGAVQSLPTWILVDSGSVRNLIDEAVYKKLPYQPPIREPGDCRVIGGNGEPLKLKGFAVLPVTLDDTLLWHEFGVVPNLPIEVLIGADILATHRCSLLYLKDDTKRLTFCNKTCTSCVRFRKDPEVGASAQLRFVEKNTNRRHDIHPRPESLDLGLAGLELSESRDGPKIGDLAPPVIRRGRHARPDRPGREQDLGAAAPEGFLQSDTYDSSCATPRRGRLKAGRVRRQRLKSPSCTSSK